MAESGTPSSRGGRGGSRASSGDKDPGEFLSSADVRTGLIRGSTFQAKPVQYVVRDGLALFEGDIVLGTVEEMTVRTDELRAEISGAVAAGVVISGQQFRWPNCRVPFTIDPGLANQARVTDAIAHWEAHTSYRFVARTTETDFVTFRTGNGCSSSVGRQGGPQFVNLATGCTTGNVIHEIGHTIGLWHEQSREDRDAFVTIHWDKIQPGLESNFNQHITDGDDVGAYDYGSIMHYPRDAFSIDGSDTITPINPPTAAIGQRTQLSAGDIAAANSLCPQKIAKEPIKDGRWDTVKEQIKDLRLDTRKEIVLDTFKEMIKDVQRDILTRKEGVFDPIKLWGEQTTRPGQLILPQILGNQGQFGGALPFAVATPHVAPALAAQSSADLQTTAAEIDNALHAVADQLAQMDAQRAALQEQYDELQSVLQQALDAHDQAQP
jgi:Astacin (Peptidase family M12A)